MADPVADMASMVANLEAKTGKSLAVWISLARDTGLDRHKAILDHLKDDHGLSYGCANLVAHKALGTDAGSSDDDALMVAMFAGPKAAIRPVYDAVAALVARLDGAEFAPKKTYVSLRRGKQFGLIQPSTKDRLDLGLVLKGVEPSGRLEAAGSWNAMVSHRIKLTSVAEVDAEIAQWIEAAWQKA